MQGAAPGRAERQAWDQVEWPLKLRAPGAVPGRTGRQAWDQAEWPLKSRALAAVPGGVEHPVQDGEPVVLVVSAGGGGVAVAMSR